jgi:hypothetical protein
LTLAILDVGTAGNSLKDLASIGHVVTDYDITNSGTINPSSLVYEPVL